MTTQAEPILRRAYCTLGDEFRPMTLRIEGGTSATVAAIMPCPWTPSSSVSAPIAKAAPTHSSHQPTSEGPLVIPGNATQPPSRVDLDPEFAGGAIERDRHRVTL